MIINKIDLLDYVDFDMKRVREHALAINPKLKIIELSCKTGDGFEHWMDWINSNL